MKKPLVFLFFLILLFPNVLATYNSTIRTEFIIDWIDNTRFQLYDNDPNLQITVYNRSTMTQLQSLQDINGINVSNYNDFDRVIRLDYDAGMTYTCSGDQINNITTTVSEIISQCQNYQTYLNGTIQYADKYAQWMAEAARCKQENSQIKTDRDNATAKVADLTAQLAGCVKDKESYYNQWKSTDQAASDCNTNLKGAKDSFASKYLIGLVLGAVGVYLFTRKEDKVAQEAQEFDQVD